MVTNGSVDSDVSDFIPIDSLMRRDADTSLIFLMGNGVYTTSPTNDDWYRFQESDIGINYYDADASYSHDEVIYRPVEPASPLACISQYQYCSSTECGPLAGFHDAVIGAAPLFGLSYEEYLSDTAKTETAARYLYSTDAFASVTSWLTNILSHLGPRSLASQENLLDSEQTILQDDQWQQDVVNWWAITLAAVQQEFTDMAYGSSDPKYAPIRVNFTSPELQKMCDSQVCRYFIFAEDISCIAVKTPVANE